MGSAEYESGNVVSGPYPIGTDDYSDGNARTPETPPRRRRTRTASAGSETEIKLDGPAPARRGRRPKAKIDIAPILSLVSKLAESAMGIPGMSFRDEEARALSDASVNAMTEFDIVPPEVTGKAGALITLVTTAVIISFPRILMVIEWRKLQEKQPRSQANGAQPPPPPDDTYVFRTGGLQVGPS